MIALVFAALIAFASATVAPYAEMDSCMAPPSTTVQAYLTYAASACPASSLVYAEVPTTAGQPLLFGSNLTTACNTTQAMGCQSLAVGSHTFYYKVNCTWSPTAAFTGSSYVYATTTYAVAGCSASALYTRYYKSTCFGVGSTYEMLSCTSSSNYQYKYKCSDTACSLSCSSYTMANMTSPFVNSFNKCSLFHDVLASPSLGGKAQAPTPVPPTGVPTTVPPTGVPTTVPTGVPTTVPTGVPTVPSTVTVPPSIHVPSTITPPAKSDAASIFASFVLVAALVALAL